MDENDVSKYKVVQAIIHQNMILKFLLMCMRIKT